MAIEIEGSDNGIHEVFLNALMGVNSDSLALSQLWLCTIKKSSLKEIGKQISRHINKYEVDSWNIGRQDRINAVVLAEKNFNYLTSLKGSGDDGNAYLFTQGISFIQEGLNVSRIGNNQSGITKGLIVDQRMDLATTNITFLESNVSFVDGFLRPWTVLVGHRSLKCDILRCNIGLHCLEKQGFDKPLKVRKTMLLRNAVPINIDAEEYNYSGDKIIHRQVQFAFDRYEMEINPKVFNENTTLEQLNSLLNKKQQNGQEKSERETPAELHNRNLKNMKPLELTNRRSITNFNSILKGN